MQVINSIDSVLGKGKQAIDLAQHSKHFPSANPYGFPGLCDFAKHLDYGE
jgi:hypothetical protein